MKKLKFAQSHDKNTLVHAFQNYGQNCSRKSNSRSDEEIHKMSVINSVVMYHSFFPFRWLHTYSQLFEFDILY